MAEQIQRFADLKERAFPDVEIHKKIEDVRKLGDFIVLDVSEVIDMPDEKTGEIKPIVIILAEELGKEKTKFTFAAGGVVMESAQKAKEKNVLPLLGKVIETKTRDGKRTYNKLV